MTLSTRALLPMLLTATLAIHGCGGKEGGDDTSGGGSGDDGGGDDGGGDDGGSDLPPEGTNAGECTDGADNDADGLFDCNDPDCAGSPDCSEANTPDGCSDGADNDADGLFDCDDPDCAGDEACGDGIEGNDAGECEDGIDNDGDGLTDCEDDDCAGFDGCDDYEGDEPGECTDGEDNDSDGLTDCDDDGCEDSPDCEDEALAAAFTYEYRTLPHSAYADSTYDGASGELNDDTTGGAACSGAGTDDPYVGWRNTDPSFTLSPDEGEVHSIAIAVAGTVSSCGVTVPARISVVSTTTGLEVGAAVPTVAPNTADWVNIPLDSATTEPLIVNIDPAGEWTFISEVEVNPE